MCKLRALKHISAFIDKVLSKCKVCEKCLFDLGHLVVVFLDAIIVFKVILRFDPALLSIASLNYAQRLRGKFGS